MSSPISSLHGWAGYGQPGAGGQLEPAPATPHPAIAAGDPGGRLQPVSGCGMEPQGDCELWPGRRNYKGYGTFGKKLAHRLAWEKAHGPVPAGLMVCHHCDNPPCVNPAHLFVGTGFDNMRDARRKGRLYRVTGEQSSRAKLTAAAVREIRALKAQGFGYRRLSRRFGVGHSVMKRILNGQDWASVA